MNNNSNVKLLAILGMTGSGKSALVEALAKRGIPKVYFGGMLYKEMEKRGIERTADGTSENAFRKEIRETEGKDWVGRQAVAEVKDLIAAGQKRIVLDGLYSWTEYRLFKHEFPGMLTTIAVVAPRALRYERLAKRPVRPFTPHDAKIRDYAEIEDAEKGGPIAIADYYILNDGSLDQLEANFATILKEIDF